MIGRNRKMQCDQVTPPRNGTLDHRFWDKKSKIQQRTKDKIENEEKKKENRHKPIRLCRAIDDKEVEEEARRK